MNEEPRSERPGQLHANREYFGHRAVPREMLLPDAGTYPVSDLADELVESVCEELENTYREAILGTDWRQTSVLRIIQYHPGPQTIDPEEPYTIDTGSVVVERYADHAPPLTAHADGVRRCSVSTITWPLIKRLSEEHEAFAELVDVAPVPPTSRGRGVDDE